MLSVLQRDEVQKIKLNRLDGSACGRLPAVETFFFTLTAPP